jgi:predicted N-formylglutamate amidohydrolase
LGVGAANLDRHIAWDIGVAGLGSAVSKRLDAIFIHQRYSRLVIDCNRAPGDPGSIAAVSDETAIPGNMALGADDREERRRAIFQPYQDFIGKVLDDRVAAGQPTILVSLHSFTPSMGGLPRPWRFGVLHRGDSAFSRAVLAVLRADWGDAAGDNQPYAMDGIDYTIPHHADANGLDYLELEMRQDLLATERQQAEAADIVADVLRRASD